MSAHFEQELEQLKTKLLTMASHAESAVARAVKALLERNDELAQEVKADDAIIDRYEIELDDISVRLLAKAPLAFDLRLITVAMKISHDLERVGDEATTIARRTLELNQEPQLRDNVDIPHMAQRGLSMLHDALEAFLARDTAMARSVIPRDKEVDAMNRQLQLELAGYMKERSDTIGRCLNLMVVAKSLERIADHATNIAEEVVFLYEGHDIRHQPKLKGKG